MCSYGQLCLNKHYCGDFRRRHNDSAFLEAITDGQIFEDLSNLGLNKTAVDIHIV